MRYRPQGVTIAAILLVLLNLFYFPWPWLLLFPGAEPPPAIVIYTGFALGVAGIVVTVGLWRMKAWSYLATNMVDGVPETTWRTAGDATGETITFTFDESVTLEQVGLVNGYAKVGQDSRGPLDWYHGNRRVLAVEWTLDDGTVLAQALDDTTITQTVPVDGIETRTVALRLVEVSSPGTGRASRDFTAISDVTLYGTAR